jgi:hypothetical protein
MPSENIYLRVTLNRRLRFRLWLAKHLFRWSDQLAMWGWKLCHIGGEAIFKQDGSAEGCKVGISLREKH